MSNTCFENPIIRDGASQQQRLTKALLPEYVAVDERKIEELKDFVLDFSKELKFYDDNNQTDGDWYDFFNQQIKENQQTEPHFALFQAFLELFSIAQNDLNSLTARHLDFYYKDVLKLKENPPVSDQVFMIFELAKHVANEGHVIKRGTRFKAGKDDQGYNVFYAAQEEIGVNKALVSEIKSIFRDSETGLLHQSDMANSADGQGAEIETDSQSWFPFGDHSRKKSDIGFAFASPILNLAEGIRMVTLKLTFKEFCESQLKHFTQLDPIAVNSALKFYFSGETEWIGPSNLDDNDFSVAEFRQVAEDRAIQFLNECNTWQQIAGEEPEDGPIFDSPWSGYGDQIRDYDIGKTVAQRILDVRATLPNQQFTNLKEVRAVRGVGEDKINDIIYTFSVSSNYFSIELDIANRQIRITRTVGKDQPAIVPYNRQALLDPFETSQPVVKVIFDTNQVGDEAGRYVYPHLIDLELEKVEIDVDVREVNTLVVQNDRTVMDPSKNMSPFGIIPVLGSTFYIGNQEVFQKNLSSLDINLEWFGLPDQNMDAYYKYYDISDQSSGGRLNSAFKADIFILDKRAWNTLALDENLFNTEDGETTPLPVNQLIRIENEELLNIPRNPELQPVVNYDTETQKGFVKLVLSHKDFGHSQYQIAFTHEIIKGIDGTPNIPNQPYNPILKSVSLNYKSSVTFDCSESDEQPEKFFHVHPFGVSGQRATRDPEEVFYFLPQYRNEGELYIGLDQLYPPQNLSILMQLLEGSEDANTQRPDVSWSFLSNNAWLPFKSRDILSDTTNGLLTSGIINLSFYKDTTDTDTILTSGKHWIRASVMEGTKAIPEFVDIISQALIAEFQNNGNDPNYLSKALAASTISKLEFSDSAIRSISQPFASFGGQVREESTAFYTRVSERLRHKQRAITIWDYERLILQAFPSVYKVKCLNHTRYTGTLDDYNQLLPGHVSVIIVSNVQNKNAVNPITPLTSLNRLEEIKKYVNSYQSDPVQLYVQNPEYEVIKVTFKVKFHRGFDKGFYQRQLEDEIKGFLSPWAYDNSPDITFGGRIHQSRIIDFIDEREYVDYVTCFKMYHPATSESDPVTEAVASTSASILCSAGQISSYGDHEITIMTDAENCGDCEDNVIDPPPPVLSADDCTDESKVSVGDPEDPFSYSVPDLTHFTDPPDTSLCPDIPEPEPVTVLPAVIVRNPGDEHFSIRRRFNVYLLKGDFTYFIPMSFKYEILAEVVEVPNESTVMLKGDYSRPRWTHMENLWNIEQNPEANTIWRWPSRRRAYFDGINTRMMLAEPHEIKVGDHVNLLRRSRHHMQNVYLPKVSSEMVALRKKIRIQVLVNTGAELKIRRADYEGIDRLQLKGEVLDTSTHATLQSGAGIGRFSIELEATKFDPVPGFNDLGWRVTMENDNYFKQHHSEAEPLDINLADS